MTSLPLDISKQLHELGYEFEDAEKVWAKNQLILSRQLDMVNIPAEDIIPSPSLEQLLEKMGHLHVVLYSGEDADDWYAHQATIKTTIEDGPVFRSPSPLIAVAMLLIELKK